MAYVLMSETLGVYLGESRQPFMTFWSAIQPAPVDEAPCFDTQEEIADLIRSWGVQGVEFLKALRPAAWCRTSS